MIKLSESDLYSKLNELNNKLDELYKDIENNSIEYSNTLAIRDFIKDELLGE